MFNRVPKPQNGKEAFIVGFNATIGVGCAVLCLVVIGILVITLVGAVYAKAGGRV